jgi:hypothetical protein
MELLRYLLIQPMKMILKLLRQLQLLQLRVQNFG